VQRPRFDSKRKMPKMGAQSRSATCCSWLTRPELCSMPPAPTNDCSEHPFKNGSTCPAPFLPHVVHNPSPCSTELPRHSLLASPLLCALLAAPTSWVTCGAPWTSCPSPPLPNFVSLSFSFVSVESIHPFFGPSRRRSRRAGVTAGRRHELARSGCLGPPPA
jgi:hypothetical protein